MSGGYELCWVIYSLDHNVGFSRFPTKLEYNGTVYYPDFLLADGKTIVETKGYEKQESVDKKTKVAEHFGYVVTVLRKEDLQYAFDYIKSTYGTSKFYELYDEYKPKYKHTCSFCFNEFNTDRKIKTEEKFCSRRCAGKFRKQNRALQSKAPKIENFKRKFSKQIALEIYNRNDKSLQQLAEDYNTTKNVVWFIKTKRTYKWIHN